MMNLSSVIEFCEERMGFKPFVAQVNHGSADVFCTDCRCLFTLGTQGEYLVNSEFETSSQWDDELYLDAELI